MIRGPEKATDTMIGIPHEGYDFERCRHEGREDGDDKATWLLPMRLDANSYRSSPSNRSTAG